MSATRTVEHGGLRTGDERLQELSTARFAAALAAANPTPGGSTAAALPAALAAALVGMVARLSAESDPFSDLSYDMDAVALEADELRAELLGLLDEDMEAFAHVMETLRLPGATAEERASRALQIQRAYEDASQPPLRVCRCSLRVLELAAEVTARGNPHTAGDAGVAALLAAASLDAAALNVELDLTPIESEPYRSAVRQELEAAQAEARPLCERLPR